MLQDSELNELRKTIELLKKQNAAAQAAINGVINTPELSCKGKEKKHSSVSMPMDHTKGIFAPLVIADAKNVARDEL